MSKQTLKKDSGKGGNTEFGGSGGAKGGSPDRKRPFEEARAEMKHAGLLKESDG